MDTAQWPQGIGVVKSSVEINSRVAGGGTVVEKKARPEKEQALNCPRCSSTNTKFCYYNNYSLSQPRYFCKTCRRYWTEGGSLRNVPVGGGSRKNKRSSSSSSTTSTSILPNNISSKKLILQDLSPQNFSVENPKIHEGQDLNLAYNPSHYNGISEFVALPFVLDHTKLQNPISSDLPVMELLNSRGNNSFNMSSIPVNNSSVSGFADEFKSSNLGFSLDQNNIGYGNIQGNIHVDHHQTNDHPSRILFPFEELKPVSDNDHQFEQQDRGQAHEASGYWNGMLAGGSW